MKLTYHPLPDEEVIRIACEGTVSLRGAPSGSDPLQDLLGPHCFRHKVVLNLERAEGMDTSGLAWLINLVGRFKHTSGKVVLYGAAMPVRQMLDVLGLAGEVPIATTEHLAIELASGPTAGGDDARPAGGLIRPPAGAFIGKPTTDVG
ncbi:MAG: hypothetical protein JWO38_1245 [Gemmataceae bacterium]|nr:hypothetical protein [Gemmataceae bacterium]